MTPTLARLLRLWAAKVPAIVSLSLLAACTIQQTRGYAFDQVTGAAKVAYVAQRAAIVSTTPLAGTRIDARSGERSPTRSAWSSTSSSARFLATKAGRGADEAFHYTRSEVVDLIEKNGLRPGSYTTKSGDLSPLQAQIDLALPPNRGLRHAVIRVDLAGLRKAGYDVGEFTRVGRRYNMPGGGTELQFEKAIPAQFLKVVRR